MTKKLINRGATSFYCVDCLAAYFAVTPDDIRERIAYFKASGCTLFSKNTGDGSLCSDPSLGVPLSLHAAHDDSVGGS